MLFTLGLSISRELGRSARIWGLYEHNVCIKTKADLKKPALVFIVNVPWILFWLYKKVGKTGEWKG